MSVDLGSQYFKIGLIKPGVAMQIALNKDSTRKTLTIVAIKDKELMYGDQAAAQRRRLPSSAYTFCVDLLGKKFNNPVVQEFLRRFPFYELAQDEKRGTIVLKSKEEEEGYHPEQLLAMIIREARVHAEAFAGQQVPDAVISIPAFFNQAERRAMVTAAQIAGVNLIALMNDNTAAGLNYGMFRRNEFNSTPTTVLIYDMGASKTTASIFVKPRHPNFRLYDRYLGGLEFSLRLRDKFAQLFAASHKTKVPVTDDHRAMIKLLDEAERVKKILSTNTDAYAQAESVHEGNDFRAPITRTEFEQLCADLFDRIEAPIVQALKMADMLMEQIDHVILMGAATRVPKVQQKLQEIFKTKELGRYLNADEAIAMGAIYFAAHRIKGYRVKKFLIKEVNFYPIEVYFASEKSEQESTTEPKILRRTLYSLGSSYPQKKMITFNKHMHDFDLALNYGDLNHLNQHQRQSFGSANITRVDLFKVAEALKNNSEEGTVFKGVRAHFNMDDSGILSVVGAEAIFHKPPPPPVEESTLSKIGHKITSFFTGSDSAKDANDTAKAEEAATNETVGSAQNATASNDTKESASKQERKDNGTTAAETKKPVVIKVPLTVEHAEMDIARVSSEWMNASVASVRTTRLKNFESVRIRRQKKEKAVHELESFLFETGDKLEQQEYAILVNETEGEYIRAKLLSVRDWMDEQGHSTTAKEYAEQLKLLENVTKAIFYRHKEMTERPNAVNMLKELMNYSSVFLENAERLLAEKIFTEVELTTLAKLLNETETWFTEMEEKQNQTAPYEDPVLTVAALMEKGMALDREVRYLLNKLKIHQQQKAARPPEARPDNYTSASNDTSTTDTVDNLRILNETSEAGEEQQGDKNRTTDSQDKVEDGKVEEDHAEL
ncbi:hypoxia up regulated protein 1 [Trichuris trichiura]|uniref:Hypoxia up-regulated protein 1 n=1 Tax=Trichuris trichiura TaxID=36087 RepID=A0A077ZEK1_TRITR|nr:hypoxia up regulated protein 1 [Trichuris trichiura]